MKKKFKNNFEIIYFKYFISSNKIIAFMDYLTKIYSFLCSKNFSKKPQRVNGTMQQDMFKDPRIFFIKFFSIYLSSNLSKSSFLVIGMQDERVENYLQYTSKNCKSFDFLHTYYVLNDFLLK